jgi:hypothetical protein
VIRAGGRGGPPTGLRDRKRNARLIVNTRGKQYAFTKGTLGNPKCKLKEVSETATIAIQQLLDAEAETPDLPGWNWQGCTELPDHMAIQVCQKILVAFSLVICRFWRWP